MSVFWSLFKSPQPSSTPLPSVNRRQQEEKKTDQFTPTESKAQAAPATASPETQPAPRQPADKLFKAINQGKMQEALKLIHQSNIDLDTPDSTGYSPLCLALFKDQTPVVLSLLKAGANPNQAGIKEDIPIPLHIAINRGNQAVVEALLKTPTLNSLDARDVLQRTPLHCAALQGSEKMIESLLMAGADTTSLNFKYQTALDTFITKHLPQVGMPTPDQCQTLKTLLKAGTPIGQTLVDFDETTDTPITETNQEMIDQLSHLLKTACNQKSQDLELITRLIQTPHVSHPDEPSDNCPEDAPTTPAYQNYRKAVGSIFKKSKVYAAQFGPSKPLSLGGKRQTTTH